MLDLTFGEQVKIILSRKGMTIKELAETIEKRTGKKMSRQNLTQRLGRDNFQEQDMRMIADILGCPFQLSILADSGEIEKASAASDIAPTEKELYKIARAKEKKVKKDNAAPKATEAERDMTIGELMDIHKELDELMMETGKLPVIPDEAVQPDAAEETAVLPDADGTEEFQADIDIEQGQDLKEETDIAEPAGDLSENQENITEGPELREAKVREQELIEPESDNVPDTGTREQQSEGEHAKKKAKGWRAYLQRITHKEENSGPEDGDEETIESSGITELHAGEEEQLSNSVNGEEEVLPEQPDAEDDYIDYEKAGYQGIEADYEEEFEESDEEEIISETEEIIYEEDIYDDEDLEAGEINALTGHEYETNSVRMHPKRIGYVQVYDRSDHRWTDMTEWAFLGYQERKKALLGKDYEPPIYLD